MLVLWSPAFFGVKPDCIIKGGGIFQDVAALMGDPNASIPTPQPVHYRPMFGAFGKALTASSAVFVRRPRSRVACATNSASTSSSWPSRIPVAASPRKASVHNGATPKIEVDAETYEVTADGELLTCAPARCCRWRSDISCSEGNGVRAARIRGEDGRQLGRGERDRPVVLDADERHRRRVTFDRRRRERRSCSICRTRPRYVTAMASCSRTAPSCASPASPRGAARECRGIRARPRPARLAHRQSPYRHAGVGGPAAYQA